MSTRDAVRAAVRDPVWSDPRREARRIEVERGEPQASGSRPPTDHGLTLPTITRMDESPAAAQVWGYLEGRGCTRTARPVPCGDGVEYAIEITRGGALAAAGQHALLSLANSAALLDALRFLGPPLRYG